MGSPPMPEDEPVVIRRTGILITSSAEEMQEAHKSMAPKAVTFSEKDPDVYEYEPDSEPEFEYPTITERGEDARAVPSLQNNQHRMSCFEKSLLGGAFSLVSCLILLYFVCGNVT
ncbi:hypothetical protein EIL50_02460 [bacterium NHP-B]|nr:hypothetical protein EIL50_02460 [bacterium NHP-B]